MTKRLTGKYGNSNRPVKNKNDKHMVGEEQQKNGWKEHFEELLNRPTPQDPTDIAPAESDLPIDIKTPDKNKICKALRQLKNNKAAGPDDIPAEALKADIEATSRMLLPLFKKTRREEKNFKRMERRLPH